MPRIRFALHTIQSDVLGRKLAETDRTRTERLFENWSLPRFALHAFAGELILIPHMKACLDVDILVESAMPQLTEIAAVGAQIDDPTTDEACATFSRLVLLLEGDLKLTFRAVTLTAKKCDELKEIAELWKTERQFCASVLTTLRTLKDKFPYCGTPELYDLALDYKRACEDRLREVEEEIECQKIELPKGLLPELN